jgi:hypothetical protein
MMHKQIRLDREEYERLRKVAIRLHRSMADCIREGIRMFLARSSAKADDLSDIAGKYRAIATDDLKPHDRYFTEAIMAKCKPRVE